MAYDKVVDSVKLDSDLTSVANGIRSILGSTAKMGLDGMPTQLGTAVSEISTQADLMAQLSTILEGKAAGGGGIPIATGTYTPAEDAQLSTFNTIEHNSGIIPKAFVFMLESSNKASYEFLLSVLILGSTNFTPGTNIGPKLGMQLYNPSSGTSFYGSWSNNITLDLAKYPISEQQATFASHTSAKFKAGHVYRWFAIGDWEAV